MIAESKYESTEFSPTNISGIYHNRIGKNKTTGLWNILADNNSFKGDTIKVLDNSIVKIEVISDTELKVTLIQNDSVIKNMKLQGKVVNDYFSVKKKLLLVPIPALYFHRERKTIIGNNENGSLILTRGYKNAAWFLVMAGDYGGISSYEFERRKN